MISMGFVQNYGGLMATRFLLGMTEAGMKPGTIFLITKNEHATNIFLKGSSTTCRGGIAVRSSNSELDCSFPRPEPLALSVDFWHIVLVSWMEN
jgi:hypothetical protein